MEREGYKTFRGRMTTEEIIKELEEALDSDDGLMRILVEDVVMELKSEVLIRKGLL